MAWYWYIFLGVGVIVFVYTMHKIIKGALDPGCPIDHLFKK